MTSQLRSDLLPFKDANQVPVGELSTGVRLRIGTKDKLGRFALLPLESQTNRSSRRHRKSGVRAGPSSNRPGKYCSRLLPLQGIRATISTATAPAHQRTGGRSTAARLLSGPGLQTRSCRRSRRFLSICSVSLDVMQNMAKCAHRLLITRNSLLGIIFCSAAQSSPGKNMSCENGMT